MTPPAAFLAVILCAAAPCAHGGGDAAPSHRERDYFEVAIPSGWVVQEQYFGLSPDEKKVYGVTLSGPSTGTLIVPRLAAHYYAPGNLLDKTPEKFIRVHSSPAGKSGAGAVRRGRVGGLPAKLFENVSSAGSSDRSLDSERIEMREGFAVIPLKRGYYVLRYSAAADKYEEGRPAFEAFVSSFRPLLK